MIVVLTAAQDPQNQRDIEKIMFQWRNYCGLPRHDSHHWRTNWDRDEKWCLLLLWVYLELKVSVKSRVSDTCLMQHVHSVHDCYRTSHFSPVYCQQRHLFCCSLTQVKNATICVYLSLTPRDLLPRPWKTGLSVHVVLTQISFAHAWGFCSSLVGGFSENRFLLRTSTPCSTCLVSAGVKLEISLLRLHRLWHTCVLP